MNSKLIRDALISAAIPMAAIVFSFIFWDNASLRIGIIVLGTLSEIILLISSKRRLKKLFIPSAGILLSLDVERIPAPYEPGKFNGDYKVMGIGLWAGAFAPFLAYYAKRFPVERANMFLGGEITVTTNFDFLFISFACILIGALCLCIWAKVGQAMVISNEIGENKRYLYRGFAEEVDKNDRAYFYLVALSGKKPEDF